MNETSRVLGAIVSIRAFTGEVSSRSMTGWFLSPTTIASAEHVTAAMRLSTVDWKPLEIKDGDRSDFVTARIQRLAVDPPERLAVVELQRAFFDARNVAIRKEPLVPEEQS